MLTARRVLLPEGWPAPRGYANGVMASGGTTVWLGGQIGWNRHGVLADGFVAQTRQALDNIRCLLAEAGGGAEHLVRLTWFVTDIAAYRSSLSELGRAYRDVLGPHYPAMSLLGVSALVEPAALVEIEATAVIRESL